MSSFADRVKEVVHDHGLHDALNRATTNLSGKRAAAFSTLDDADILRDMARRAKFTALRTFGANLVEFESRLIANGVHVHWASDGAEACGIVNEIARRRGVRSVVKSKSMVTEEIYLNTALESAGLHVVETDLGEYIIQLAGETPSHIVAPIIHMTRDRVGEVMQEKLGVPYSNDPEKLAAYAREKLREEFLDADMGVSGANFGVVETGTICIITNEGNGRMVTTLPKTHVVVMGIEKLIPAMSDLDVMLKIIARSATGQNITSYTTLVRGPKKSGEKDGPDEVHVVLLDNGRTGVLAGGQAEILGCIRCGSCLNACPVYNSIGGHAYNAVYSGPVGSVATPCLRGLEAWKELPNASTLCGACTDVCPVRLDIPRMLTNLRAELSKRSVSMLDWTIGMKGFGFAASTPPLYRFFRNIAALILNRTGTDGWVRKLPGMAGGWTQSRDLKAPAKKSFTYLWNERKARGE